MVGDAVGVLWAMPVLWAFEDGEVLGLDGEDAEQILGTMLESVYMGDLKLDLTGRKFLR